MATPNKFAGSGASSNAMRVPANTDPAGWGQFGIWMNYQCPHPWVVDEGGSGVTITPESTPQSKITIVGGDWVIIGHDNAVVAASPVARI